MQNCKMTSFSKKRHYFTNSPANFRNSFSFYNIAYEYDELTQNIINRNGDGICTMEETVKNISDPKEGFAVLKNKSTLPKKLKNFSLYLMTNR